MLWSAHWKKSSQFAWIGRKQPLQGPRVFPEAGTKAQMSVVLCLGGTGKAEWQVESDSTVCLSASSYSDVSRKHS